jgi:hypothetical protein
MWTAASLAAVPRVVQWRGSGSRAGTALRRRGLSATAASPPLRLRVQAQYVAQRIDLPRLARHAAAKRPPPPGYRWTADRDWLLLAPASGALGSGGQCIGISRRGAVVTCATDASAARLLAPGELEALLGGGEGAATLLPPHLRAADDLGVIVLPCDAAAADAGPAAAPSLPVIDRSGSLVVRSEGSLTGTAAAQTALAVDALRVVYGVLQQSVHLQYFEGMVDQLAPVVEEAFASLRDEEGGPLLPTQPPPLPPAASEGQGPHRAHGGGGGGSSSGDGRPAPSPPLRKPLFPGLSRAAAAMGFRRWASAAVLGHIDTAQLYSHIATTNSIANAVLLSGLRAS